MRQTRGTATVTADLFFPVAAPGPGRAYMACCYAVTTVVS